MCVHILGSEKRQKGQHGLKGASMIFNLETSPFFFFFFSGSLCSVQSSKIKQTMYALQIYMAYQIIAEFFVSCKQEVIMMLDQCRRDFSALIDRINVQDAFEKADYKDRYNFVNVSLA